MCSGSLGAPRSVSWGVSWLERGDQGRCAADAFVQSVLCHGDLAGLGKSPPEILQLTKPL